MEHIEQRVDVKKKPAMNLKKKNNVYAPNACKL